MGGSEHDGGSVFPPMQAPHGSHVTGRLPYDWGFRPPKEPMRDPERAPRGRQEGLRGVQEGPLRRVQEAPEEAKEEQE